MALQVQTGAEPLDRAFLKRRVEREPTLNDTQRFKAKKKLYWFLRYAWPIIEPGNPFVDSWHLGCLCEHLQAMTELEILRLVINMPRRRGKSTVCSVAWFCWAWISQPHTRWGYMSYGKDLSMRDSVRCRDVIMSDWYQSQWPLELKGDQNAKLYYANAHQGYRIATSTGGKVVGFGGDYNCLPYDQKITTDRGDVPIGRIVDDGLRPMVAAYDHRDGKIKWRKVVNGFARDYNIDDESKLAYNVKTSRGISLKMTDEHPVYVIGVGYVPACRIKPGNEVIVNAAKKSSRSNVRDLQIAVHGQGERGPSRARTLLFERLFRLAPDKQSGNGVRGLFKKVPEEKVRSQENTGIGPFLLQEVSVQDEHRQEASRVQDKGSSKVCCVRSATKSGAATGGEAVLLFSAMCRRRTQQTDGRRRKLPIHPRSRSEEVPATVQRLPEEQGSQEGSWLHGLRNLVPGTSREVRLRNSGSSHRQGPQEQRLRESDLPVPYLSQQETSAWEKCEEVETDIVVAVDRIPAPRRVFNIEVEGLNNYFAEGILVHNCADDPHDYRDAWSAKSLDDDSKVWINGVQRSVNDPKTSRFLVVMQRLAENDLSGVLTRGDYGYEHLCLPEEYEVTRVFFSNSLASRSRERDPIIETEIQRKRPMVVLGREVVYVKDPRRKDGELLSPERYPREVVDREKRSSAYEFASQNQQRPHPLEGTIIKESMFKYFRVESREGRRTFVLQVNSEKVRYYPISLCVWFQTIDTALKDSEELDNDLTAVCTWALTPGADLLLYDCFAARIQVPYQLSVLNHLSQNSCIWIPESNSVVDLEPWPGRLLFQAVEEAASGVGLIQEGMARGNPFKPLKADQNPLVKVAPLAADYAAGLVYHLEGGAWVSDYEEEALGFPHKAHNDRFVAASYGAYLKRHDIILRKHLSRELVVSDREAVMEAEELRKNRAGDSIGKIKVAGGTVLIEYED